MPGETAGLRPKEPGGVPVLRLGRMKDGPEITDNANFVIDTDLDFDFWGN